jgi:hypothetical protein
MAGASAAHLAAQLLIRLRFSNAQVERVVGLVAAGPLPPPDANPAALRRWLSRVGPLRLPDLTRLWIARARVLAAHGVEGEAARTRALWTALRGQLRARPPLSVAELALDGRDLIRLGLEPGPHFKEILGRLLDHVLEDPARNDPDRLAELVRENALGEASGAENEGGSA